MEGVQLPGLFERPAGLGDVLVGVLARLPTRGGVAKMKTRSWRGISSASSTGSSRSQVESVQ